MKTYRRSLLHTWRDVVPPFGDRILQPKFANSFRIEPCNEVGNLAIEF